MAQTTIKPINQLLSDYYASSPTTLHFAESSGSMIRSGLRELRRYVKAGGGDETRLVWTHHARGATFNLVF